MPSFLTKLAFIPQLGVWEILVIGVIALLIFGKRLPEVGKSLGKGIVEFKKGLKGIEDEIEQASEESDDPKRLDEAGTTHASSTSEPQSQSTQSS